MTKTRLGTGLYSVLKRQVYSINISTFPMTPFFAATYDDSVHPSQVVAGMQQIRPEQQTEINNTVLSNEERLASVPEAPVLIYMVKTEEIIAFANHVRENVI